MTTDNLIIGPARILVGTAGNTLDDGDLATLAAGSTPSGWTELGHTTSAVTIKDTPTYVKATSQQSTRVLDVAVSAIETTIATSLLEATATRLAEYVNGTNASGTVTPGGLGLVKKFACSVFGPGPDGDSVLFSAPRCVYTGDRTISFDSGTFTSVEVTIEILDDPTTGGYTIYVAAPGS